MKFQSSREALNEHAHEETPTKYLFPYTIGVSNP